MSWCLWYDLTLSLWTSSESDLILGCKVSTAAQAASVVAAARFPPKGIRGFGSPFTQAIWGISAAEYLTTANDHVLVLVQIETREGVQNLEQILDVDGLGRAFV